MSGIKIPLTTSCRQLARDWKKFASAGSFRCWIFHQKLRLDLYRERRLRIFRAYVQAETNYSGAKAGTLLNKVCTGLPASELSPAQTPTRLCTNQFRCLDLVPKISRRLPPTTRDGCGLIKCRNWMNLR